MVHEIAKASNDDLQRVLKLTARRNANHRVIAIVMAAYVEEHLTHLIKRKMPGLNRDLSDRLFEGNGPLSTIAAKIDIARALKIIDATVAKNAVLIARVRNRFAHRLEVGAFDHSEVAPLIDKLITDSASTVRGSRKQVFVGVGISVCATVLLGHVNQLVAVLKKEVRKATRSARVPSPAKSSKPPRPRRASLDPKDQ